MEVKELLKKKTRIWQQKVGLEPGGDHELTEEQQAIVDAVKDRFGCYEEDVAKLMSAVTHIPLEFFTDGKAGDRPPATAVVRLKSNPNSHDYPIGRLIVVGDLLGCGNCSCGIVADDDGEIRSGNTLPVFRPGTYDYVSPEEAESMEEIFLQALVKK